MKDRVFFPRQKCGVKILAADHFFAVESKDNVPLWRLLDQIGGAQADVLFDVLVRNGGFANVDLQFFLSVLKSMGAAVLGYHAQYLLN